MPTVDPGRTIKALLDAQLVTDEQVDRAMEHVPHDFATPVEALIETGAVTRDDVVRTTALLAGFAYVDLSELSVNATAAALLPAEFARRTTALPVAFENGELLVAVGLRQAGNIELKDDLTRMTRSRIRFAVAHRADIEAKINQVYRAEG